MNTKTQMFDGTAYREWRERVEAWHPLPDGRSCIDYMVTEAGEAVDARLRMDRPGDDRSKSKQRNLGKELAQVVDMAAAAALRYGIDLEAELWMWMQEVEARNPQHRQEQSR